MDSWWRGNKLNLCSYGLNKEDNEFICHYFKEKFKIEASVQKKDNKYYILVIESKLNLIAIELLAIEFNQIDQRTYFTLQMKCDKINRHKIFCFLCKSYVNEAHFNEYHYANHECDKCGIF
jgi:hypothetical protein